MPFKCHNLHFINDQILYNNLIKIFLCDLFLSCICILPPINLP